MEQKIKDIAMTLGLLMGAVALMFVGLDLESMFIYFAGGLAFVFFLLVLVMEIVLLNYLRKKSLNI